MVIAELSQTTTPPLKHCLSDCYTTHSTQTIYDHCTSSGHRNSYDQQ